MRRFSSNDGMYDDSTDGDYVQHSDAMVFVRRVEELRVFEQSSIKNAIRVVELEADLKVVRAFLARAETRIAELEKQAALDKSLLALADARINRELRDDFAGRAMQGLLARPGGGYTPAMAYAMADEMLKAKGGA